MNTNLVSQVRPTSTFDSFEVCVPEQQEHLSLIRGIAEQLVSKADHILNSSYPFDHARFLIFHGKPGRGKTHLIEGLINYLKVHAPQVLKKVYLSRGNFTNLNLATAYGVFDFDKLPIVVIDDMFVERNLVSEINELDIATFMKFVYKMYEERRFVIITCNFALKAALLQKIMQADKTGRVISRLTELLSHSGESEIKGDDYRQKKAASAGKFSLF